MFLKLGYHEAVKRLNRAAVAGLVGSVLILLVAATATAQINAAPPSVTSLGFGGHPFSNIRPSVTSLGPQGYTPGYNPAFPNSNPTFSLFPGQGFNGHHHHHHNDGSYGYGWGYAVPYYGYGYGYYDDGGDDAANAPPQDQYNGGPTIFDRRGPGAAARAPATTSADRQPAESASVAPPSEALAQPAPVQDQPQTVLVFRDGHQLEVGNYAIVGDTLYDLTGGRRRRIPLSDLDLDATIQQNDDRGIDFQVPSGSE